MREALLREVEATYSAQRAENQREEARRQLHAAGLDPQIGELSSEREHLFHAGMKEAFDNPGQAKAIGDALREKIALILREIRQRLASAGLPEDYLQPVFDCSACRDTGYIGEPVRERCECFARRLRTLTIAKSGSGLNPRETFEAFDPTVFSSAPLGGNVSDTQQSYMVKIRDRCFAFVTQYPKAPQRNVLMVGSSGLGKTYLVNCIGNSLLARGFEVQKLTAYQLSERLRDAVFGQNPEAFSALLSVPVLLLDDLGAEPLMQNITIEYLFTLINERDLFGRSTVISTNLMPNELKMRYTERVCSRLFDKRNTMMLLFQGGDVRLR